MPRIQVNVNKKLLEALKEYQTKIGFNSLSSAAAHLLATRLSVKSLPSNWGGVRKSNVQHLPLPSNIKVELDSTLPDDTIIIDDVTVTNIGKEKENKNK